MSVADMLLPDYENIINLCKKRMLEEYPLKQNTWLDCDYVYLYKSLNRKLTACVTEEDLIDAINFIAIIYQKRRLQK